MTPVKHTPGPWRWYPAEKSTRGEYHSCGVSAIPPYNEAVSYGDTPEQAEANARLIAAAPELLESLQAVMREEAQGGVTHISEATYEKARASIAKATGEART